MGGEIERALLARAEELADTGDLAMRIIEIIGWARAARVDQEALGGLVTAVRLLGGDVIALFRAVRGRYQAGKFNHDTELLEIVEEVEGDISDRVKAAARVRRQVDEALQRARSDLDAARRQLSRARAMHVTSPCDGCHRAKTAAIEAAQLVVVDAQERERCASGALEVLAPLKLPRLPTPACCQCGQSRGEPCSAARQPGDHLPVIPCRRGGGTMRVIRSHRHAICTARASPLRRP